MSEPQIIGDLLADLDWNGVGRRHDVIRTGPRDEIPGHVRLAIWFRDHGKCWICGEIVAGEWHLDHINPWSAGGLDHSNNLRILCAAHNVERSNRALLGDAPRRPVTWWCINCTEDMDSICVVEDRELDPFSRQEHAGYRCQVHGYDCRVTRACRRTEDTSWFNRGPMSHEDARTLAYCAHCDAVSLTDRPL